LALCVRVLKGDFVGYLWDKDHRIYQFDITGSMGGDNTRSEKASWRVS